jgi:hypothetical protein
MTELIAADPEGTEEGTSQAVGQIDAILAEGAIARR